MFTVIFFAFSVLLLLLTLPPWVALVQRKRLDSVYSTGFYAFPIAFSRAMLAFGSILPVSNDWAIRGRICVILAWLFWELFGYLLANSLKVALSEYEAEIDRIKRATRMYVDLVEALNHLVAGRMHDISLGMSERSVAQSVKQMREILRPDWQVRVLLESLTILLSSRVKQHATRHNFRAGIYLRQHGHMEPIAGYNWQTKVPDPFTSPLDPRFRRFFDVNNHENPSFLVKCVQSGRLMLVDDCSDPAKFMYFHDQQGEYLKSIAAYPISSFMGQSRPQVEAALIVDTTIKGYFNEEEREQFEILLAEYACRLDLEYRLQLLFGM